MQLRAGETVIYSSTFDPKTGALVRVVETPEDRWGTTAWERNEDFKERYPRRTFGGSAFSPVPETVDIAITDKCGFGCTYCYMDSTPTRDHARKELVEQVITGFKEPPYQLAIGGGEPTSHPDFPWILRRARELGTVPNYTTNGEKFSQKVIDATNAFCGGVAMTYHSFKGFDWFREHYLRLRDVLKVQVNVHLIADKDVAKNLRMLSDHTDELGKLRLVLLAYYPDVGRASLDSLITKRVYQKNLPDAVNTAMVLGHDVAFSEGLLPYFFSRPGIGVNTQFAMRSEGLFSCFIDTKGRMSVSSFNPPTDTKHYKHKTVWEESPQSLWDTLNAWGRPHGDSCYQCEFTHRCATPHDFHYLMCNFAAHNKIPLKDEYATGEDENFGFSLHDRIIKRDIV